MSFKQRFVQLPDSVQVGIAAVFVWVVTQAFFYAVSFFPFLQIFAEFVQPVSLVLAAYVIAWISNAVPDQYGPAAVKAIEFILLLLAMFGVGTAFGARPLF